MYYYEVLVAGQKFHSEEALTYGSDLLIEPGVIVTVPLRNGQAQGIVAKRARQPRFKVKHILRVCTDVPLPKNCLALMDWMRGYYPSPGGVLVSQFIPAGLVKTPRPAAVEPAKNMSLSTMPGLNKDQEAAVKTIEESTPGSTIILHGDTGTGKTRIYIELAAKALENGKSVVILTPEISLTPQLVREFDLAFNHQIVLLHSGLTVAERRNAWTGVLYSKQPQIIIGPRSALFSPIENIGLLVVDESHEAAYKQDSAPNYDARRVASYLAKLHGCVAVFGSATPSVSDYYVAGAKKMPIIRLNKLAVSGKVSEPTISIVMARDRTNFGRHPYLSDQLLDGVNDSLNREEQVLLFLNRRGTARLLLCQNCGWQANCPNCDLPLTYHGDSHTLLCHTCGHKSSAPSSCPDCRSTDIIFRSHGTKSIVEAVSSLFPKARIQRFDTDNSKAERLDKHYEAVSRGDVDILIGTQMLTKGLDLPKLGFVGVVSADTSLSFPDYTATEKTYQMITQVIGRIARGHRAGSAVIQTYQPDSPAIRAAVTKDWGSFYQSEIEERRQFGFPPFWYLLKLSCVRKTPKGAQKAAGDLATTLAAKSGIKIIGPSPSFYEKRDGEYRWQIIVKAKNRGNLVEVVRALPSGWHYDIDPSNLL